MILTGPLRNDSLTFGNDILSPASELRAASSLGLGVIREVARVRRCKVAQTAVNPLTTDALRSFLKSADETRTVELIGNRVFIGAVVLSKAAPKGSSPAIADLPKPGDLLT